MKITLKDAIQSRDFATRERDLLMFALNAVLSEDIEGPTFKVYESAFYNKRNAPTTPQGQYLFRFWTRPNSGEELAIVTFRQVGQKDYSSVHRVEDLQQAFHADPLSVYTRITFQAIGEWRTRQRGRLKEVS